MGSEQMQYGLLSFPLSIWSAPLPSFNMVCSASLFQYGLLSFPVSKQFAELSSLKGSKKKVTPAFLKDFKRDTS